MQDQSSGSPENGEPTYLAVGKLRRPHGVQGEILMTVWTDFPERLKPGALVYVGSSYQAVSVRDVRWHRDDLLISFNEYPDREGVGVLRNQVVAVRTKDLPVLPDGELYLHQVLGMKVFEDSSNQLLGTIREIIETGANDVYVVRNDKGMELLLPAIDPVVLEIDIAANEMRVYLLPGLLPENE
jgi:16S rRNA processing protein RimM